MAIKVLELAYIRVQAPDLDAAERFFNLFGLPTRLRTENRLYVRGAGPEHYLVVTERGEQRLLALAFEVASEDELHKATALEGASGIEAIDEPGGGRRVRLADADGNRIELVHGIAKGERLPMSARRLNTATERDRRRNLTVRPEHGPAHVIRLGHAVMRTTSVSRLAGWYTTNFGFLESDDVVLPDGSDLLMSFLRLDHGDVPVDHHVFQVLAGKPNTLHHVSFEVEDIDDLQVGHAAMAEGGYKHMWGVGRHLQGSQIFDYWLDPFGVMFEHWTDTDVFDASVPKTVLQVEDLHNSPWGPVMPQDFLEQGTR
jgi:catechol 2,3-dioxygenase-like lactoylglutathione lyase family enzyme